MEWSKIGVFLIVKNMMLIPKSAPNVLIDTISSEKINVMKRMKSQIASGIPKSTMTSARNAKKDFISKMQVLVLL